MTSRRTLLAALALVPAAAILAVAAWPGKAVLPYTVTGAEWPTPAASFRINPGFTDPAAGTASQQIETLRLAADEWRLSGGSPFQFNYAGTTSVATIAADGVNAVYYSPTDGGGALAVCYWWTSGGQTTNFDIVYYDRDGSYDFVWAQNPTSSQFHIRSVGAHEFGHALGLGHSAVTGATMYPSVAPGSTAYATLAADDMAGVQFLYGVAPPPSPVVSLVAPSSGWIDGGTAVQITGSWFPASGLTVSFGGASATGVVPVNAYRVDCVVPAGAAGGPVSVEVSAASGGGALPSGFTYENCRFTGPATYGAWSMVEARFPADAGLWYQGAFSLGNQGFPVYAGGSPPDLRIIPLDLDWALEYTITYGTTVPYFATMQGFTDGTGAAGFGVLVPYLPYTAGITLHTCCLTGQPSAPSGVQSISTGAAISF